MKQPVPASPLVAQPRPGAGLPAIPPWRLACAAVLAAVAIWGILRIVDGCEVGRALEALGRRPGLVALVLAGYTAAFALRAEAWRRLLPAPRTALFGALQASLFLNHLLPVKAGEVARPLLAARHGAALRDAAATTVVTRLLDVAALAGIAGTLLAFSGGGPLVLQATVWPLLVVAGTVAVISWLTRGPGAPAWLPAAAHRAIAAMREGLSSLTPRQVALAAAITLPSWLLEGVVLWAVAEAAGVGLPWHGAIAATAATIVFQVVHVTPGGIGVYEAAMTAALAPYGLAADEGLLLATTAHALKFAYAFTFGAAFGLLALRGGVR
jgi:hypothetical protein